MVDDALAELKGNCEKAVEGFKGQLAKVRTGRASLAMLDGIRVEYYGTPSPLNQVSSLTVADPRLIVIKPWEKQMCPAIEKTIRGANLGLNPSTDGEVVRVPIPPLTEERRRDLVKQVKGMAEESKVAIRNHRREANELLDEILDGKDCSEDEHSKAQKKVQETTDLYVAKIDDLATKKEKEVLEV